MKVLIIHHVKPYHLDDYLAVSLLLAKYRDAERRTVRKVTIDELKKLSEDYDLVIAVDIGSTLYISPNIRVYDHHHDITIPCSLILVLKNEFPVLWKKIASIEKLRDFFDWIDYRDRFGVQRANAKFGIEDPVGMLKYLPTLLFSEPSADIGRNIINFVESFAKVEEEVDVIDVDDLRVAITEADPKELPASVIFDVTGADLLVQPNTRDPKQTSIIKNSESAKYYSIDLTKLREAHPVTFIHPNGFLAVLKYSVPKVREIIIDIVKTIT